MIFRHLFLISSVSVFSTLALADAPAPLPTEPLLPQQNDGAAFLPPKGGATPVSGGVNPLGSGDTITRKFGDNQKCMDEGPGAVILVEYKQTKKGLQPDSAKMIRSKCKEQDPSPLPVKELEISTGGIFRYEGRKFQEVP